MIYFNDIFMKGAPYETVVIHPPDETYIRQTLAERKGSLAMPMLLAVAKGVRKKSTVFYFAINGNLYFGNKRGVSQTFKNISESGEWCKEWDNF